MKILYFSSKSAPGTALAQNSRQVKFFTDNQRFYHDSDNFFNISAKIFKIKYPHHLPIWEKWKHWKFLQWVYTPELPQLQWLPAELTKVNLIPSPRVFQELGVWPVPCISKHGPSDALAHKYCKAWPSPVSLILIGWVWAKLTSDSYM